MKYKTYQLQEVCSFIDYRGKTPPKTTEGIPLVTAKIVKNGMIQKPQEFIAEDFYDEWMRRGIPKKGSVIFTTEAPLGEVARIQTDEKLAFAQRIIIMEPDSDVLDADYLFYALQDITLKSRIQARATGTTVIGIKAAELKKVLIDLPPLNVQKKIASILSAFNDKIALNKQINDNLEQQAQAIYIYLQKTAVEEISLSHFINIKHGYAFKGEYISSEDNGKVLVTPGNFKIGGGFKEERCKFFSGEIPKDYILKPGSLIVTMTDLSKQADTLGYGAFVPLYSDRIYLHNQRIGLITQTENTLPLEYIYWFLRSYEYHSFIVGSASGSTVKHTSPSRILEQAIPIPERKKMEYLFPVLKKINEQIDLNNYQNCKLKDVRDILLPRLMSGKIDISDINI